MVPEEQNPDRTTPPPNQNQLRSLDPPETAKQGPPSLSFAPSTQATHLFLPPVEYLAPCDSSKGQAHWVEQSDCGSIGIFPIIRHGHIHIQLQVTSHHQGLQAECREGRGAESGTEARNGPGMKCRVARSKADRRGPGSEPQVRV